jgi:hypothetical protein
MSRNDLAAHYFESERILLGSILSSQLQKPRLAISCPHMMMKDLLNVPVEKLKRLVALKTEIEKLQGQVESLMIESSPPGLKQVFRQKRKMSAAVRKKISEAATARWAKIRAGKKK